MGNHFSKKNSNNKKKENIYKDINKTNNNKNEKIYLSKEINIWNKKENKKTEKISEEINNQETNIGNNSNIFNYEFIRNIATDSYSYGTDNAMAVFKSINDILYFIYSNNINSIISYNLIDNKKINEIKNAHNFSISSIKHYLYKYKNQDLVLSSSLNNNLKLWRINDWECLLNIENVNKAGNLWSACLLILND